jgi:hypothetical protein
VLVSGQRGRILYVSQVVAMTVLIYVENAMADAAADIVAGRCAVWELPRSAECAGVARRTLRDVLLKLCPERLDDCLVMVNELVTNAFVHGLGGRISGRRLELAAYRRGSEGDSELVITVYDPQADLDRLVDRLAPVQGSEAEGKAKAGAAEDGPGSKVEIDALLSVFPDVPLPVSREAAQHLALERWSGQRGLELVRDLSGGRCGFRRTTSRGGERPLPGKVAWIAVPLGSDSPASRPPQTSFRPPDAAHALWSQLDARGMPSMFRSDLCDQSVLSLRHTTVWVDSIGFRWNSELESDPVRYPHHDLVEVVERLIEIHEDEEYDPLRTSL